MLILLTAKWSCTLYRSVYFQVFNWNDLTKHGCSHGTWQDLTLSFNNMYFKLIFFSYLKNVLLLSNQFLFMTVGYRDGSNLSNYWQSQFQIDCKCIWFWLVGLNWWVSILKTSGPVHLLFFFFFVSWGRVHPGQWPVTTIHAHIHLLEQNIESSLSFGV